MMNQKIVQMLNRGLLWLQRTSQVGQMDGIRLVDTEHSALFKEILIEALNLIKKVDNRRFRRIQHFITWVVNCPLPSAYAEYHFATRTCRLDFEKAAATIDSRDVIVAVATTLVHEATHGLIRAKGIEYSADVRSRIERCCVKEQNRFLARNAMLKNAPRSFLQHEFQETLWNRYWTATRSQSFADLLGRFFR